jgi:hypothetical protein
MTRDQIIITLAALERRLDDTITLVDVIIDPDGSVVGEIKKAVYFPRNKENKP